MIVFITWTGEYKLEWTGLKLYNLIQTVANFDSDICLLGNDIYRRFLIRLVS